MSAALTSDAALRRRANVVRVCLVVALVVAWEIAARFAGLAHDIVPSFARIGSEMASLVASATFWSNLAVTAWEIAAGMVIGTIVGLATGLVLGGSRFLGRAFEPLLLYLGPTPKIIFFPVLLMWFGVGAGSKIAMAAISCFFPVAIATAAGMRAVDPVLIRVGRSFRANTWQMVSRIYLPAMRRPVVNGIRLGLGVALIGTLLAETKLSNSGLGYLVIQAYAKFDLPRMYALLILLFVIAVAINTLLNRYGEKSYVTR